MAATPGRDPIGEGGREGQVECRCCEHPCVGVERIDANRLHKALASVKVRLPWGEVLESGPDQYEIFTCPVCEYAWLEAMYYPSAGIRVDHLTFGMLSGQTCTMHVRIEEDPITGEDIPVEEVYLLGCEPVDYKTWHGALMRQRLSYQAGVAMNDHTLRTDESLPEPSRSAVSMNSALASFWDHVRLRRAGLEGGPGHGSV